MGFQCNLYSFTLKLYCSLISMAFMKSLKVGSLLHILTNSLGVCFRVISAFIYLFNSHRNKVICLKKKLITSCSENLLLLLWNMYARGKPIQATASASMAPNNLAVNLNAVTGSADILFLHKSAVHLMLSDGETGDFIQRPVICKIPSINQQVSYVLIMQVGVIIIVVLFITLFINFIIIEDFTFFTLHGLTEQEPVWLVINQLTMNLD